MQSLTRYVVIALFPLLPIASCTLIADVDESKLDDETGGTSGAAGSGGAPRAGSSGSAPRAGRDAGGETGVGGTGAVAGETDGGEAGDGGAAAAGQGGMGTAGLGPCALTRCGDDCVSTGNAPEHCGACGRPCVSTNGTGATCVNGRCNQACNAGFGNCSQPMPPAADDGCETDFNSRQSCGTSCDNARACAMGEECIDGACSVPCDLTRCGAECVDPATTEAHCGGCGRACVSDERTQAADCSGGRCVQGCAAGFGNCSSPAAPAPDDGCETDLSHPATCGTSCATLRACANDETCIAGACVPLANCTDTLCANQCIDVGVGIPGGGTSNHCGACDRACSRANAASARCAGGSCEPSCNDGFDDCNAPGSGQPDDGCETNLTSGTASGMTVSDCGECGRDCSNANATSSACTGGRCTPTCATGFGDCETDAGDGADNGCETDLQAGVASGETATDCGACGRTCSVVNAGSASCVAGACVPACTNGFSDCNPAANDGCETTLASSTASCGACGRACAGGPGTQTVACDGGLCVPVCNPGFADCTVDGGNGADDGCETNLNLTATCGTSCGGQVQCALNQVCNAGTCGAPGGLAVLSVPAPPPGSTQTTTRFADQYQNNARNLLNAAVTIRLYAPGAASGNLNFYVSDADFTPGGGAFRSLSSLSTGWTDVTLVMGGVNGSFDPSAVIQIRMEVQSGTTPVVIYVDSIVSSNGQINDQFTTSESPMILSSSTQVPGSTVSWAASL